MRRIGALRKPIRKHKQHMALIIRGEKKVSPAGCRESETGSICSVTALDWGKVVPKE